MSTNQNANSFLCKTISKWKLLKSALVCMLSRFSCAQLFATLWTVAHQALCPWDSLGKNTGVGCHALLQGIFPTQESNPHLLQLLHCRQILYRWATREAPNITHCLHLIQLCSSCSSVVPSACTVVQLSPSAAPECSTFNLSQHQGLSKRVSSSHHVAKVLEFQLQHQSFQWIFRVDFL